tara:strand:- start:2727 stop:3719 length:993 start_codon:yes stop_codon:yes gene_type:complete
MSLEQINNKIPSSRGKVEVLLANHAALWADSVPAPIVDSNEREGWFYTNTSATNKANLYFFDGLRETVLLSQIGSLFAKLTIDNHSSTQDLPFFIIYTKPTGVNDAGAFYHSRIVYSMNASSYIGLGEEIIIHTHHKPDIDYDCRFIPCQNITVDGDGSHNEEILYMTIHTDSGATPGNVKILFQNVGFRSTQGHARNIHLKGFQPSQYPTAPTSGILLTQETSSRSDIYQTISITDNAYAYSNALHNLHPAKGEVSIWGNTDTQTNDIEIQYSSNNVDWYFASNHYVSFHGGSNGDFALDFRTNANYIRVVQYNNHGSVRNLIVNLTLT